MLEVKNLVIQRGQHPVVKGVKFSLDKPELIGLIGPNGAGKSTIMKALAGLLNFEGEITLNKKHYHDLPSSALAKIMAYLPQERVVHWPLSCEDVVMLGRTPHRSAFSAASVHDHEIVAHAMEYMKISDFGHRPFSQLSGGEQARVLIARLLAQEPDLIIADEPINGLDPSYQISLMSIFQSLVKEGKTVLCSLHELSLASQWCDRVILLDQGKIIADDIPQNVMTKNHIQSVYGVEILEITAKGKPLIFPTGLIDL